MNLLQLHALLLLRGVNMEGDREKRTKETESICSKCMSTAYEKETRKHDKNCEILETERRTRNKTYDCCETSLESPLKSTSLRGHAAGQYEHQRRQKERRILESKSSQNLHHERMKYWGQFAMKVKHAQWTGAEWFMLVQFTRYYNLGTYLHVMDARGRSCAVVCAFSPFGLAS